MSYPPAAEWVPIGVLRRWSGNPRRNDHAVGPVAESIRRYGFGAPIVARREDHTIIAGHTRLEAARRLGLEQVPVRYLDLSAEEARQLALVDNKTGEAAEWDLELLRQLVEEDGLDLEELGWSAPEAEEVLAELEEEGWGWSADGALARSGHAPRVYQVGLYIPADATIERAIDQAALEHGIGRGAALALICEEWLAAQEADGAGQG